MEKNFMIVHLTKEELKNLLAEQNTTHVTKVAVQMQENLSKVEKATRGLYDHFVDRHYLTMNFKWRRRKIEQLERDGRLRPVAAPDGKSKHYRLGDCLELKEELEKR